MTQEELLDKIGIALDNFTPRPNSTIIVTIDPDQIPIYKASDIIDIINEIHPNNAILVKIKGVDIN